MFFSVRELEVHPVDFDQRFAPGAIDLGPEIRQRTPLSTQGHVEVIPEHRGARNVIEDIRLVGNLATRVEVSCARCLDPVSQDLLRDFDLLYRPQGADRDRGDEAPVSGTESEISYYEGEGLLLEDVLREQVLLALPLRVICRADCKGLCPHCGRNLNQETCNCTEAVVDPRWDALRDLKNKL
jgi:uncharacterized protein